MQMPAQVALRTPTLNQLYPHSLHLANLEDVFGEEFASPSMEELRCCKDWNQVELELDCGRFPPNINEDERQMLQTELTPLIVQIMWENRNFPTIKVSTMSACPFLQLPELNLEESAMTELQDVYVLLYLHDPDVEQHMRFAELGALFALSWPLTWFSHDLQHYSQIVIFFDLFLSSHHMMPYTGNAYAPQFVKPRSPKHKRQQNIGLSPVAVCPFPSSPSAGKNTSTRHSSQEPVPWLVAGTAPICFDYKD
uniref:Rab-GAP TBC domain-containing protein n=2 Tax=Ditylenchus dipsaci TaxID=166011 RepID=A0A915DEK4_9BILA